MRIVHAKGTVMCSEVLNCVSVVLYRKICRCCCKGGDVYNLVNYLVNRVSGISKGFSS